MSKVDYPFTKSMILSTISLGIISRTSIENGLCPILREPQSHQESAESTQDSMRRLRGPLPYFPAVGRSVQTLCFEDQRAQVPAYSNLPSAEDRLSSSQS